MYKTKCNDKSQTIPRDWLSTVICLLRYSRSLHVAGLASPWHFMICASLLVGTYASDILLTIESSKQPFRVYTWIRSFHFSSFNWLLLLPLSGLLFLSSVVVVSLVGYFKTSDSWNIPKTRKKHFKIVLQGLIVAPSHCFVYNVVT